jgi:hypothetical protein
MLEKKYTKGVEKINSRGDNTYSSISILGLSQLQRWVVLNEDWYDRHMISIRVTKRKLIMCCSVSMK